jgi:hypothetical protein
VTFSRQLTPPNQVTSHPYKIPTLAIIRVGAPTQVIGPSPTYAQFKAELS